VELFKYFQPSVEFLIVYIHEAHSANRWPIGSKYKYDEPETTEQRMLIARDYLQESKMSIPLLLDRCPENDFDEKYSAWPIRFYIFERTDAEQVQLSFLGMPQDGRYDITLIWSWLRKRTGEQE